MPINTGCIDLDTQINGATAEAAASATTATEAADRAEAAAGGVTIVNGTLVLNQTITVATDGQNIFTLADTPLSVVVISGIDMSDLKIEVIGTTFKVSEKTGEEHIGLDAGETFQINWIKE